MVKTLRAYRPVIWERLEDPATNSVTLIPRKMFPRGALQLDINARLVRDRWGKPLNGGHDYIATIRRSGKGSLTARCRLGP
jgi:hypothetical protein